MTTDPGAFVMPFGRHKDKPLAQVPRGYLRWALDGVPGLYPETRAAIEAFLAQRPTAKPAASGDTPAAPPRRRAAKKREASPATCATCGLAGSKARPLYHLGCGQDEAPF